MCQVPNTIDFNNPDDIIRFVVDNNYDAVKNNFNRAGLGQGGLTPCMLRDKLIALNNQGTNIKPILTVPILTSTDNYTKSIAQDLFANRRNANANAKGWENWSTDISNLLAGLGTGIGGLLGGGSQPTQSAPPAPSNNTPYIIGGIALLAVVLLFVFLKK